MGQTGACVAAIVTTGEPSRIAEMAATCQAAARSGAAVRVFFRDESIPPICRPDRARQRGILDVSSAATEGSAGVAQAGGLEAVLEELAGSGDVRLYACSSSLYLWGVSAADLLPAISGSRGLVAFLAEDLADATQVLSY